MDLNLEEVLEEEGLVPDRVLQNLLIKVCELSSLLHARWPSISYSS